MTMGRGWTLLVAFNVALGCSSDPPGAPPASAPKPDAARPVPEAEVADGMCKEHGVLEAICTKCNPKLIPVFQAKGDWCAEHEFPESICPIHHPERGGRPAADVGNDGAPPDGMKIRFKASDTGRLAGIKTVPAEVRPGGARLTALAGLAFDATKRAEVNAVAPGVIRELKVDVGARVKPGDTLALVESASVGADQGRLRAAASRLRAAEATHARVAQLADDGLTARKEEQAARVELEAARADVDAVRSALSMVGGAAGAGRYKVQASLAGTVIRREATVGRLVDAEELLFEIADTSTMWAEIEVPERDAARVEIGQPVVLEFDALADRIFEGHIEYVAPEVDRRTRTVSARATVANPDGKLRAHMFGKARIALGGVEASVVVPRAAVHQAKGVALVFVRLSDTEFETRRVKTGVKDTETVELISGVKAGEAVATEGSFLLKTETLKDSIGAGCCEVD